MMVPMLKIFETVDDLLAGLGLDVVVVFDLEPLGSAVVSAGP